MAVTSTMSMEDESSSKLHVNPDHVFPHEVVHVTRDTGTMDTVTKNSMVRASVTKDSGGKASVVKDFVETLHVETSHVVDVEAVVLTFPINQEMDSK